MSEEVDKINILVNADAVSISEANLIKLLKKYTKKWELNDYEDLGFDYLLFKEYVLNELTNSELISELNTRELYNFDKQKLLKLCKDYNLTHQITYFESSNLYEQDKLELLQEWFNKYTLQQLQEINSKLNF